MKEKRNLPGNKAIILPESNERFGFRPLLTPIISVIVILNSLPKDRKTEECARIKPLQALWHTPTGFTCIIKPDKKDK